MSVETLEIDVRVETVPGSGAVRVVTFAPDGVRETVTVYGIEPGDDLAATVADAIAGLVARVHRVELARDDFAVPTFYGDPVAYWIEGSFLVCRGCADADTIEAGDTGRDPDGVMPVLAGGETDSLSACHWCGVVVAESLTEHGRDWVRELATDSGFVSAAHLVRVLDACAGESLI
jgi:hypothetical protein